MNLEILKIDRIIFMKFTTLFSSIAFFIASSSFAGGYLSQSYRCRTTIGQKGQVTYTVTMTFTASDLWVGVANSSRVTEYHFAGLDERGNARYQSGDWEIYIPKMIYGGFPPEDGDFDAQAGNGKRTIDYQRCTFMGSSPVDKLSER